jgi:hypothetical protein
LVRSLDTSSHEAGHVHFVVGDAEVVSHVTLERRRSVYAVLHFGGMDVQFFWMPHHRCGDYEALKAGLTDAFQNGSLGDLYQRLLGDFHEPTHQLQDLFRDEQRRIVENILRERIEDYQVLFEQLFDQDHAMLKRLARLRYPVPEPMRMAASVSTERRIREIARRLSTPQDQKHFSELLGQAKQWGNRSEPQEWERFFLVRLEQEVRALFRTGEVDPSLAKAGYLLEAAELLGIHLNLSSIQHLYVQVCNQRASGLEAHREAVKSFAARIRLNPEAMPPGLR